MLCRKTIHQELENVLAQFRSLVPVLTATCMLVQRCEDDREEHSRAASAPQTPTAAIENRFANISAAAKCSSIAAMPLVTPPQQRLRRSSMPEIQLSQHQHLLSTARLFSTNACPHGLIAHVSDMHRLRNAIAQIKGLREIEPFWYNVWTNFVEHLCCRERQIIKSFRGSCMLHMGPHYTQCNLRTNGLSCLF